MKRNSIITFFFSYWPQVHGEYCDLTSDASIIQTQCIIFIMHSIRNKIASRKIIDCIYLFNSFLPLIFIFIIAQLMHNKLNMRRFCVYFRMYQLQELNLYIKNHNKRTGRQIILLQSRCFG